MLFNKIQPLEEENFASPFDFAKYILVWRLSWIFTVLFAMLTFAIFFYNPLSALYYGTAFVVCIGTNIYLIKTTNFQNVFWIFTLAVSTIIILSMHTLLNMLHYADIVWTACIVVFSYIGLGNRVGNYFLALHATNFLIFYVFGINLHIDKLKNLNSIELGSGILEFLIALFTLTYLLRTYIQLQVENEAKLMQLNESLQQKNNENRILMQEIHHRIKNNLQLVVSLLRMQQDEIGDQQAEKSFDAAIHRIHSISLIHQKLYQNDQLNHFNFQAYVEELTQEIKSIQQPHLIVDMQLKLNIREVGLKTIVPLGLILNELITNSFKHGFHANKVNQLFLEISQESDETILLRYTDSGEWKTDAKKGFGSELMDLLVQQMEGSHTFENGHYEFRLRNLDLE